MTVVIYYSSPGEVYRENEQFPDQLSKFYNLQDGVLVGNFNCPDISWTTTTGENVNSEIIKLCRRQ